MFTLAFVKQAEKTKDLVCKLLFSLDSDPEIRSKVRCLTTNYIIINLKKFQLRDFSLILLHRKFEFTASGLIIINRSLVTTVRDTENS